MSNRPPPCRYANSSWSRRPKAGREAPDKGLRETLNERAALGIQLVPQLLRISEAKAIEQPYTSFESVSAYLSHNYRHIVAEPVFMLRSPFDNNRLGYLTRSRNSMV